MKPYGLKPRAFVGSKDAARARGRRQGQQEIQEQLEFLGDACCGVCQCDDIEEEIWGDIEPLWSEPVVRRLGPTLFIRQVLEREAKVFREALADMIGVSLLPLGVSLEFVTHGSSMSVAKVHEQIRHDRMLADLMGMA